MACKGDRKNLEHIIQERNFILLRELVSKYGVSDNKVPENQQLKFIIQKKFKPNPLNLEKPIWITECLSFSPPRLSSFSLQMESKSTLRQHFCGLGLYKSN